MEAAIERLAALAFIVTGLSHLLAPRGWVGFFERVAAQGEAAGIWNGLLHLPLGLVIVLRQAQDERRRPGRLGVAFTIRGVPNRGGDRVGGLGLSDRLCCAR